MVDKGPQKVRDRLMPGAAPLAGRPVRVFDVGEQTMPALDRETLNKLLSET